MEPRPREASAQFVSERVHAGSFEAGGVAFRIETNSLDFAGRVGDTFRDLQVIETRSSPVVFEMRHRESAPPTHPWGLWRDGEPREMTVADGYVLAYLLWEVSRLMFERSGDRVHLHGAALAFNGRAVVLSGRSGAGKSTLAAWLTHRGWGFLTDEAALVDPDALIVFPFWRPIGIRRPGPLDPILPADLPLGWGGRESLVPASTIGTLARATPLAAIALLSRAPREPTALYPLSPAAALVELTQHFPGLIEGGRAGFRRLARLVEAVPAYVFQYDDLDAAEDVLRTLAIKPR
jgi:hypothetical protein